MMDHMPGGRGAARPQSLTTETRKAVVQTAHGLVHLSRVIAHCYTFLQQGCTAFYMYIPYGLQIVFLDDFRDTAGDILVL